MKALVRHLLLPQANYSTQLRGDFVLSLVIGLLSVSNGRDYYSHCNNGFLKVHQVCQHCTYQNLEKRTDKSLSAWNPVTHKYWAIDIIITYKQTTIRNSTCTHTHTHTHMYRACTYILYMCIFRNGILILCTHNTAHIHCYRPHETRLKKNRIIIIIIINTIIRTHVHVWVYVYTPLLH